MSQCGTGVKILYALKTTLNGQREYAMTVVACTAMYTRANTNAMIARAFKT